MEWDKDLQDPDDDDPEGPSFIPLSPPTRRVSAEDVDEHLGLDTSFMDEEGLEDEDVEDLGLDGDPDTAEGNSVMFNTFRFEDLSSSQHEGLDFTLFSPTHNERDIDGDSDCDLDFRPKGFDSLMKPPDFTTYIPCAEADEEIDEPPKIERPVQISKTFRTFTVDNFISGASCRLSRSRKNKISKKNITYISRLKKLKPVLESKITKDDNFRGVLQFPNICDVFATESTDSLGEECDYDESQGIAFQEHSTPIVLWGYTVKTYPVDSFKLEDLCDKIGVIPFPLKHVNNSSGGLFLEDETGRIRLDLRHQDADRPNLNFNKIISGVPIAVKGVITKGSFLVSEVIFPTPDPPSPFPACSDNVDMVFISGLRLSNKPSKSTAVMDFLFDFLQGMIGSEAEQEEILTKKTRVVFLGDSFEKPKRWNPEKSDDLSDSLCNIADKLDYHLEGLAKTAEVFLMPGENDPTFAKVLPQPPIHLRLFPKSSQLATFHCLTNPAKITLDLTNINTSLSSDDSDTNAESFCNPSNSIQLVLSSGTNVKEAMNECEIDCPLEMCEKLLQFSHLHPSSIDDGDIAEDLLTLFSLPHLFVVGGLSHFQLKHWNGVRIVGVPTFSSNATIVVLYDNGAVKPINFKIRL